MQENKLKDYILNIKKLIPEEQCDAVLEYSVKLNKWQKGTWYNYGNDKSEDNTHDTCIADRSFMKYVENWRQIYLDETGIRVPCGRYNVPVLNRYSPGEYMESHCDHIHSIFDGKQKGIPVMTTLGIVNDNFKGGDFVFWEDYKIDLEKGDVLVFPSLFLYPHRVDKITFGVRYSWISWWF